VLQRQLIELTLEAICREARRAAVTEPILPLLQELSMTPAGAQQLAV
jgi:hypothetical protein